MNHTHPALSLVALFAFVFLNASTLIGQEQFASYGNAQVTIIDEVEVAASDPGIVRKTVVSHGQSVASQQPIVLLDDRLPETELKVADVEHAIAKQQAESDFSFSYAKKSEEVNRKQLDRSNRTREQFEKSITMSEIERLQLEFDRTKLATRQAELELDTKQLTAQLRMHERDAAQVRLDRRKIRSPFAGTVVDLFVKPGEWVQAGQSVARVVNLDRLRVKAFLPEKFANRISKTSPCRIEFSGNSTVKKTVAEIYFISPEINPSNQDFEIWADIANENRQILPGMRGTLIVEIDQITAN